MVLAVKTGGAMLVLGGGLTGAVGGKAWVAAVPSSFSHLQLSAGSCSR